MNDTTLADVLEAIRQIQSTMATKDDIANMATKDDLAIVSSNVARIDKSLERLYAKVFEMEDNMATKADIARLDHNIDAIRNILDRHSDFLETDELERLSLGKQVSRHEDWIERAAAKIAIRYQPQG